MPNKLFVERIEILEQPERRRYRVFIECRVDGHIRPETINIPLSDGRDAILHAIKAYWDKWAPEPSGAVVLQSIAAQEPGGNAAAYAYPLNAAEGDIRRLYGLPNGAVGVDVDPLDALRAEAEAAGVRVDGRWGEARLREVIATVQRGEAAQDA